MLKFTFLIHRTSGMSKEIFVDYHRNHHAPLFMSIPESGKYVKKYVISHPKVIEGFPEPAYDGITDIYFESMDDFNSFFASENYKMKVRPDESNFIELGNSLILISNELIIAD